MATTADPVTHIPMSDLEGDKKIGSGAFSTVYQMTWHRQLGHIQVAAKRLNKPEDDRELKMLSRLKHPNIIKLLGVVDESLHFFLILELCEGGSLRSYLDNHERPLPTDQFFDWAKQVANPIQYLKQMTIVHKDIKSPNIVITGPRRNTLKLADFGLARSISETMSHATVTASYPWMAPELLKEQILSPSYDIFTYGVVVWELWTREFPFKRVPAELIVVRVCKKNERLPIPKDMPKAIAKLIEQCWDKNWKKRPSIEHILDVITSGAEQAAMVWETRTRQIVKGPWIKKQRTDSDHMCLTSVNPNGDYVIFYSDKASVFSSDGKCKININNSVNKKGRFIHQITVSADGTTYFMTQRTCNVTVYDEDGKFQSMWESPHLIGPNTSLCGLAMSAIDQVLVGDVNTSCIHTHRQDGTHINSIKVGITPQYLNVTSKDTIIVSQDGFSPQIINKAGQILHTFKDITPVYTFNYVSCYRDLIFITNTTRNLFECAIECYSDSGVHLGILPIKQSKPCSIVITADGTKAILSYGDRFVNYLLQH